MPTELERRKPRRLWGILNIVVPLLLGIGILISLALYDRDATASFKLWLAFGAIWIVVALVRSFQVGRGWDTSARPTESRDIA